MDDRGLFPVFPRSQGAAACRSFMEGFDLLRLAQDSPGDLNDVLVVKAVLRFCVVKGPTPSYHRLPMTFTRAVVVTIAMLAAGCAATPASTAPKAPGDGDKPKAEAPEAPKEGEAAPSKTPAAKGKTLAEHEADYRSGCQRTAELGPYCDCAWKVFSGAYTVEQMNNEDIDEAKLAELTKKTSRACGEKLPESELRAGFMKGCVKDDTSMQSYCECFWPELTSRFSLKELASDQIVGTPKHSEANKAAFKKCGNKVPEATVKASFLKNCGRGAPEADKFCQCAWKETRSVLSPAQIQTTTEETPELTKAKEKVQKGCAKLRPAH